MGVLEDLLGKVVVDGQKKEVLVATLEGSSKVLGIYFSAHWCPPCRNFTPKLAEFYGKMKERLEVVFVSSDEDEAGWSEYFAEMPWLALPFSDRDKKEALGEKFDVEGIPTFVLLDASTGAVLQADAVQQVEDDPMGTKFPWKA